MRSPPRETGWKYCPISMIGTSKFIAGTSKYHRKVHDGRVINLLINPIGNDNHPRQ